MSVMLAGATASFVNGYVCLGIAFVALGIVGLVLTLAKWLPALHRLPGVGAIPPPEVEFHLEAPKDGMTFLMNPPSAKARVLLCAGFKPGRHEITRVSVNVYVVGSTDIVRTHQGGAGYAGGGVRMEGPDAPYWTVSNLTIPLGAFLMFFKVTIPAPGEYEVVLTVQSPDLYDKGDHYYRDTLIAGSSEA